MSHIQNAASGFAIRMLRILDEPILPAATYRTKPSATGSKQNMGVLTLRELFMMDNLKVHWFVNSLTSEQYQPFLVEYNNHVLSGQRAANPATMQAAMSYAAEMQQQLQTDRIRTRIEAVTFAAIRKQKNNNQPGKRGDNDVEHRDPKGKQPAGGPQPAVSKPKSPEYCAACDHETTNHW